MKPIERKVAWQTLGRGLPVRIEAILSPEELQARLAGLTRPWINSAADTFYPPKVRDYFLTGHVSTSRARLCVPRIDRTAWAPLSPVFHGRIEPADAASSCLVGVLRVRLYVLVGALLMIPLVVLQAGEGTLLDFGILLPLLLLAKFVWDVMFALPKTTAALLRRLEQCVQGNPIQP